MAEMRENICVGVQFFGNEGIREGLYDTDILFAGL
jgi:hypothetical protein